MRSPTVAIALLTVLWTTEVRAGFFDLEIKVPDVCEIKCKNADEDALFPQGTINGACVSACRDEHRATPPSPGVRPSGNNRAFVLLEPLVYSIGATGVTVIVPAGFVTDYASIPEKLWSLYSPHDQYSRAAVIHDYLYWSQLCTREQADNILMIAMKESEVPEAARNIVYEGVRLGGGDSWSKNQVERKAGMPRVVPIDRKDFPPNWSWEMYRKYLMQNGVVDPAFKNGDYCSLGDNRDVPLTKSTTPNTFPINLRTVTRALFGVDMDRFNKGPFKYN